MTEVLRLLPEAVLYLLGLKSELHSSFCLVAAEWANSLNLMPLLLLLLQTLLSRPLEYCYCYCRYCCCCYYCYCYCQLCLVLMLLQHAPLRHT
jgi:hypothetical protein